MIVQNGRVHLTDFPPIPTGDGIPPYDTIHIYRNVQSNPGQFFLVGSVTPGQDFTDARADAAISDLTVLANREINLRLHEVYAGLPQYSMARFGETTSRLDEVVWTVNPRHDTLASLAEYLAQCATSYLGPLEITCHVDAPLDWPPLEIRAQARHNLVLALKEALQNVVKHARATEVTLTLRHEPPHLLIRLTDDGAGLPDDSGGAGKDGLANMRTRLESIGGTCSVRRREKGGTEVEMRAPLPTTRRSPAP